MTRNRCDEISFVYRRLAIPETNRKRENSTRRHQEGTQVARIVPSPMCDVRSTDVSNSMDYKTHGERGNRDKTNNKKRILKCLVGVLARWNRTGRVVGLYPLRASHDEGFTLQLPRPLPRCPNLFIHA